MQISPKKFFLVNNLIGISMIKLQISLNTICLVKIPIQDIYNCNFTSHKQIADIYKYILDT